MRAFQAKIKAIISDPGKGGLQQAESHPLYNYEPFYQKMATYYDTEADLDTQRSVCTRGEKGGYNHFVMEILQVMAFIKLSVNAVVFLLFGDRVSSPQG